MRTLNDCFTEMEVAIARVEECIAEARKIMAEAGQPVSSNMAFQNVDFEVEPLDINLDEEVIAAPVVEDAYSNEQEIAGEQISETEVPEIPELEASEHEEPESEITVPETPELEASEHEEPESEITVPETSEPEVSESEVPGQEASESEVSGPEASELETSEPEPLHDSGTEPDLSFGFDAEIPAEQSPETKPLILDGPSGARKKAVLDVAGNKDSWRNDIPGTPVKNILSAISLNDRILFINTLFRKDTLLFQSTIKRINDMTDFESAESYLTDLFPEWKLDSEVVYRLMMAIRRRFC